MSTQSMAMAATDFPEWTALQRLRANDFRPKREAARLYRLAMKWLPVWPAPYGGYHWTFCVEIEQERRWNFPEFRAGVRFGRLAARGLGGDCPRDANPHKAEPSRERSWDCGYVWGLHTARLIAEAK